MIFESLKWLTAALCLAGGLGLSGCASVEKKRMAAATPAPKPKAPEGPGAAEKFAAASGSARIRIDLGEQRAYFYKGGELVTSTRVSTGKPGFRTPSGSFRISSKAASHRSSAYGRILDASGSVVNNDADSRKDPVPEGGRFVGASMPYFMRFNGGIGMHAGYVPGYPASHGCVRLPRQMAQLFFQHAPVGTPVAVTP
jgi:lipoprotein-anchoring transpeptidase ErfK/SrfK